MKILAQDPGFTIVRLNDDSTWPIRNWLADDNEDEEDESKLRLARWRTGFCEMLVDSICEPINAPYYLSMTGARKDWNFQSTVFWNDTETNRTITVERKGELIEHEIHVPKDVWKIRLGLNVTAYRNVRTKLGRQFTAEMVRQVGQIDSRMWTAYYTTIELLAPIMYVHAKGLKPANFGLGLWLANQEKLRLKIIRQMLKSYWWMVDLWKDAVPEARKE